MAQTQRAIETNTDLNGRTDAEELPSLVSELGSDIAELFDAKVGLLKLEVKEDMVAYLLGAASIAGSIVIATIGIVFASLAAVFALSNFFPSYGINATLSLALGFVIVGAVWIIIGLIAARVFSKRLAQRELAPETVEELRKDKRWIQNEV